MSGASAHPAELQDPLLIDLFCRVIDNYGDIGVCWRLARCLTEKTPHHVRLWVDNLSAFQHLAPQVDDSGNQSLTSQIKVMHWHKAKTEEQAGEVVIEAFACTLPDAFLPKMLKKNSLWINLEYLSAEDWVNNCHGLPSLQTNGLRKYFFFPGFTAKTGGLLREPDLLNQRDGWLEKPHLRWAQLAQSGLSQDLVNILKNGGRQVFYFTYPGAPINALVNALKSDPRPTVIIQPQGSSSNVSINAPHVHHATIPFVPQIHFDALLWGSDLNLVRGEDSLVRAIWAGKPFVWHIYPQTDDTHMKKLSAWLHKSPFEDRVKQLQIAWNRNDERACHQSFKTLLGQANIWRAWNDSCREWSADLARQPDLATNLLHFFTEHAVTR